VASKIEKWITARRLSLGVIIALALMLFLSTLVPQQRDATTDAIAAWRLAHSHWLWLVDLVRLHSIYVQPWFAATILLAAMALGVSSLEQFSAARKRLHALSPGEEIAVSVAGADLRRVAGSRGYRSVPPSAGSPLKFVRNRWGYFGNSLLHAGMVLVIGASSLVALTGRQGVLILAEGEQRDAGKGFDFSEHGILAKPLQLPGTVRLEQVMVSFDAKNQPAEVASRLTLKDGSSPPETFTAAVNRISELRGLRVYHSAQYGDAFAVEITDPRGGVRYEKLPLQQPVAPGKAGYGNFDVSWSRYGLSAKYYADAGRKGMTGDNPQLTLRLMEGGREAARTTLSTGKSGALGSYRVRLIAVQKWSKLFFVDLTGMPVVFAGFAIIMLGGLIHYLTPPRELFAVAGADGLYRVSWRAVSFRDFFLDERDRLAAALRGDER